TQGRVAFVDGDALPDIVLVPVAVAGSPSRVQVLLSRPTAIGQPAFLVMPPVDLGDFQYEAIEVADLDGDEVVDLAVVSGTELSLGVGRGNGDGTFTVVGTPLIFTVPTYGGPDPLSHAVGLHSCQNGIQPSLALVLSGVV